MADYPIEIEMLTRFRTAEQKILRCAGDGTIDILIGTHKILGKDLVFHDLGLLIVDEEQRFGVQRQGGDQTPESQCRRPYPECPPHPQNLYFAMVRAAG